YPALAHPGRRSGPRDICPRRSEAFRHPGAHAAASRHRAARTASEKTCVMKPQRVLVAVLLLAAAALAVFLFFRPGGQGGAVLSGYVEGEPLYPASPVAGRLVRIDVTRGDSVQAGATLFQVDPVQIAAQRDEAASQLVANKALAQGARVGQRPQELQQIQADLNAARAVLAEAEKNFE